MGVILTEFDNTLEKSEIIMSLESSSKEESGEDYHVTNMTDKLQTLVFGIQTPIIMINNTVVDFGLVRNFKLSSKSILPTLSLTVEDRYELIKNIDKPGVDNEIRIQILPKFDDAYKKINLTFYVSKMKVYGKLVELTGTYKLSPLTSTQFKSFGEIDTYNLFKTIAEETKLGFASNITEMDDKRYIYCDFKSYLSILSSEISYSNSTVHVLDWWIDFWDNIVLADIKERYNTVDPDEDLQIWVTGQIYDTSESTTIEPTQTTAVITNYPGLSGSELFFSDYKINSNPSLNLAGSDTVYGIYEDVKGDYEDHLVQFEEVNKDIFVSYKYEGETYGGYNYLLANCLRSAFFRKINLESITVTMDTPVLALMRGHKLNLIRYVNDDNVENRLKVLEEHGLVNRNIESNISLEKYELTEEEKLNGGNFNVDKTVSAQYLINAIDIVYENNKWKYILTLIKPANKQSFINKN